MALAAAASLLRIPAARYNSLLERRPVLVKSLTSGLMYASGDLIAQFIAHSREQREAETVPVTGASDGGATGATATPASVRRREGFRVDWRRLTIFFAYGTLLAGPMYHVWFNQLDLLPAAMFKLRQMRQRNEVLKAYALLRRHGVEVDLKVDKLPNAKPFSKWTERGIKIAADQLVFSTIYTLVFFVS